MKVSLRCSDSKAVIRLVDIGEHTAGDKRSRAQGRESRRVLIKVAVGRCIGVPGVTRSDASHPTCASP